MEKRFSACELIEMGVRIEENGRDFYLALCGMAPTPEVESAFRDLAQAEEDHIKFFRGLSGQSCQFEPIDVFPEEYFAYIRALADQYIFTRSDSGRETAENTQTYGKAIDLGIKLEKDSILFYQEMGKILTEKDRAVLDKVIDEERSHLSRLVEMKKTTV
jgi:rubrerythrin